MHGNGPIEYRIDNNGWLQPARHCPSPNFNARPSAQLIDLLVIHNISLPPGEFGGGFIEQLFTNNLDCTAHPSFAELRDLQVSAHLLIDRDGAVTQFVAFTERAWHAGKSSFDGRDNCNDFSIGIELEGADTAAYSDAQYRALAAVTAVLLAHFPGLNLDKIVGHCDIAPARKTDPGPAFEWARYRQSIGA
ncbi:MAG: N-acetylmuramoyl-L-alanine amidase family protein [Verrucomicrobiaceae bacterium]|nr:N-acetylmuramoyl-L-alanine amidase family protein [Verrucomicrobiaceae bacterium]